MHSHSGGKSLQAHEYMLDGLIVRLVGADGAPMVPTMVPLMVRLMVRSDGKVS